MTEQHTVETFVAKVQAMVDAHFAANYPRQTSPEISTEEGPVYIRVIKNDRGFRNAEGMPGERTGTRSVHCFIRKADGAVMKAGSWKAPARNGVRTYLHDLDPRWVTYHGMAYCR